MGDGLTGHLFLVINDDEYTKVTPGTVKPTPPLNPTLPAKPTISTMITRSTSDLDSLITYDFYWMEYQAYQQELDTYLLYHNTSKCLGKQIVATVPLLYIEELENQILKFGNVSILKFLSTYVLLTDRLLEKTLIKISST